MSSRGVVDAYAAAGRGAGLLRLALYLLVIASPVALAMATSPETDHPFVQEVAKSLALVGYAMLTMQFVLAARFEWIERPFGLDALFTFHRKMGMYAGLFLLAHPVLYASADAWAILRPFDQSWRIVLGQVGAVVVVLLSVGAAGRRVLKLEFETWRRMHNVLALVLLGLGFAHSWFAGGDLGNVPMRLLWVALVGGALAAYLHHTWVVPRRCQRYAAQVAQVVVETADVWTLVMKPAHPSQGVTYLPGQFIFLTLYREALPVEEHPFSISSSPAHSAYLTSTIKASGDYTATIGQTSVGDRAALRGPFGRFSYVLHPDETDLVFVAGGVGITPLLSMLRHMRDTHANVNVRLIYANRTEADIVARKELDEIAAGSSPTLQVHHVLSNAGPSWTGEQGRVDATLIEQYAGDVGGKVFYISGPPRMISDLSRGLSRIGVPSGSIRVERFEL